VLLGFLTIALFSLRRRFRHDLRGRRGGGGRDGRRSALTGESEEREKHRESSSAQHATRV